jgi:uncharacterized glyoxalase superfamily protein PhnB
MNDTPPAPTVWHTLRAREARALIDFLVEAFGFVENVAYEEDGIVAHAQLDWPEGGGIMLGDDRPGSTEWRTTPGTAGAYVVTADVDAVHARAVAAGAEILEGPVEREYGGRDFIARDPEGNIWSFGTYPGQPRAS